MAEKMRMTASEREGIMRLGMITSVVQEIEPNFQKRAQIMPGFMKRLHTMQTLSMSAVNQFKETLPEEQYATYNNNLKLCKYRIGAMKGTGGRDDVNFGIWLPMGVINGLLEAVRTHCDLCNLDTAERRACRLRKTLDNIPNDIRERDNGDCPYFTL